MNGMNETNLLSHDSHAPTSHIMRLFEIQYRCGFCHHIHTSESYFTGAGPNPAQNLDDLYSATMATLKNPNATLKIVKAHAAVFHHDQGNLHPLVAQAEADAQNGITCTFQIGSITMTGEDRFLCDECGRQFPSLAQRWEHMGRHPLNGHRVSEYACAPD